MEIDSRLTRFYGLFLAYGRNISAVPDDFLADMGMTHEEARALVSRQDFPWGELEDRIRQLEFDGRLATEYGMSLEEVAELRRHLHKSPADEPVDPRQALNTLIDSFAAESERTGIPRVELFRGLLERMLDTEEDPKVRGWCRAALKSLDELGPTDWRKWA